MVPLWRAIGGCRKKGMRIAEALRDKVSQGNRGAPTKSADFVGRGAATERADFGRQRPKEHSGVCGDEKEVV